MEVGSVGTKLGPQVSTSVSMEDSCWEERFLIALFLKLIWSSWRIKYLLFLNFLIVRVSGKSFFNDSLEYGPLGCAIILKFSEPTLWFLLMSRKEGGHIRRRSKCLVSA